MFKSLSFSKSGALRALSTLLLILWMAFPANAQNASAVVVSSCAQQTLSSSLGFRLPFYMDQTGDLCTSANGSFSFSGPLPAGTNNIGTVVLSYSKTTPTAGSSVSVTTGGTAVVVFAANSITTQGIIKNPNNATESLFVDLVNNAQVSQNGGTNGTTYEIPIGGSFVCPPSTKAVTVNATTSGHQFVATSF